MDRSSRVVDRAWRGFSRIIKNPKKNQLILTGKSHAKDDDTDVLEMQVLCRSPHETMDVGDG